MFQSDDINYIFESVGQNVLINANTTNVVITNPPISEYEEKYIHSLTNVPRGSLIDIKGNSYLVVSESIIERGIKYKVLARHCNYSIKVDKAIAQELTGYDPITGAPIYKNKTTYLLDAEGNVVKEGNGRPILIDVYEDEFHVPAIVDVNSFSVKGNATIRYPSNQIEIIVQDNDKNTSTFKVNFNFAVMGKQWSVVNQDKSKKGMLILTCELAI